MLYIALISSHRSNEANIEKFASFIINIRSNYVPLLLLASSISRGGPRRIQRVEETSCGDDSTFSEITVDEVTICI